MQNILSSQQLPLSQLRVSAACKDWLAAALAKDPCQRWSADKLLQHEWITQPLPAEAHSPQLQAAATDSPAAVPVGYEDAWEQCWHPSSKQRSQPPQQLRAHQPDQQDRAHTTDQLPAQQRQQQQGCVPPWVEDDWVAGLDKLSSQLSKADSSRSKANSSRQEHTDTERRQQDEQDRDTSLQQLHSLGITSWED
jgi:serine/threonine protein kinase